MRGLLAILVWLMAAGAAGATEDRERGATARYEFEWSPGLQGFAQTLMDSVEADHDRIYGSLGLGAEAAAGGGTVVLLRDEGEMWRVAQAEQGGRPPDWAQGLAYPRTRHIYMHAGLGPSALRTTLQHEVAHLAVGDLAGARAPRWFSEGIAIEASEGFALDRVWLLTEAATMDALLPLSSLNRGFPASGARAGVAYAQAVHFVGFLRARAGPAAFAHLLRLLRDDGLSFEVAVQRALGEPLNALEAAWTERLRVRWGWLPVIFGTTGVWVMATFVLVLAWRRRRRQQAARMVVLAGEEAVDMAEDMELAYDLRAPPELHDPYDGRPPTLH